MPIPPAPTHAPPILVDPATKQASFNPIWLGWFLSLTQQVEAAEDSSTVLETHLADTANPHSVTKGQIGLGNADNTSDVNKPVSTAQATAIGLKLDTSDAPELVRDTIGTALVAGTNVTVTVNDPSDTITIAASSGAADPSYSLGTVTILTETGKVQPSVLKLGAADVLTIEGTGQLIIQGVF